MKYESALSSFATNDLSVTKKFYEEILDLDVQEDEMGFLNLNINGTTILIYPKDNHVSATFTVLNLHVANIDDAVDELASRGISFERYEGFNMDEKNIARGQLPNIAWFQDPSGNIISIVQN